MGGGTSSARLSSSHADPLFALIRGNRWAQASISPAPIVADSLSNGGFFGPVRASVVAA